MLASTTKVDTQRVPLASHGLNCLPWRANKGQTSLCAFSCKSRVLAQLCSPLVPCHVGVWKDLRSRNLDVCLGSPAPLRSELCGRHRGMQRAPRGSQHRASSVHAVIGHRGLCRGLWFGCRILKLSGRLAWSYVRCNACLLTTWALQCNFSTVGYEHRGKRFGRGRNGRVAAEAIGSKKLAREVSRLPESTHSHD